MIGYFKITKVVEISNAFVGTIIGRLGGGELQLSCKKKSINYIPSLIEMLINLG